VWRRSVWRLYLTLIYRIRWRIGGGGG